MRWDGLMTCQGDWEVRQPQDFVRGVADIQAPPYVRPEQQNYFIPINFTSAPDETIAVDETLAKATTKRFGGRSLAAASAINGTYLNELGLNVTAYAGIDPESITLTETVLLSLGRSASDTISFSETVTRNFTKNLSDTISIAESLQLVEIETIVESLSVSESIAKITTRGSTDTLSISESVTTTLVSPTALNGSVLNSLGLD